MRAIVLSVSAALWMSLAHELRGQPPVISTTEPPPICKMVPAAGVYFTEMREAAIAVHRELCIKGGNEEQVFQALVTFIEQQRQQNLFAAFGGFANGLDPLAVASAGVTTEPRRQVPAVGIGDDGAGNDALLIGPTAFEPRDTAACDREAERRAAGLTPAAPPTCLAALREFLAHYNYAQAPFSSPLAFAFAKAANTLSQEWDRYLNETRSQTPLELLVNTAVFRRSETSTSGFRSPPTVQWIVLHPNLVVENVSDAIDGEDTIEALMIELAGINFWRTEKWYVPSGGSIVSVYSDRPGVDDAGYGIALHFRSVYSLGFTSHDGDDGWFVSFDLLKLLQDKQKVLDEFKP